MTYNSNGNVSNSAFNPIPCSHPKIAIGDENTGILVMPGYIIYGYESQNYAGTVYGPYSNTEIPSTGLILPVFYDNTSTTAWKSIGSIKVYYQNTNNEIHVNGLS